MIFDHYLGEVLWPQSGLKPGFRLHALYALPHGHDYDCPRPARPLEIPALSKSRHYFVKAIPVEQQHPYRMVGAAREGRGTFKPGVCCRADSAAGRRPRLIRGAASPLEVLPRAAVLVPGVGGGVAVRHAAADRRPAGRTHESPGAGGVDATPVQQRLRGRAARRIKLCYHKAQR